jgi:hypothetical protein
MPSVTTTHPRKAHMLRIALIAAASLFALAGPAAAAQPISPRVNSLELENTMISGYSAHAAPGTQVGSEG